MSVTPPSNIDFDKSKRLPSMIKGLSAVKEYFKVKFKIK